MLHKNHSLYNPSCTQEGVVTSWDAARGWVTIELAPHSMSRSHDDEEPRSTRFDMGGSDDEEPNIQTEVWVRRRGASAKCRHWLGADGEAAFVGQVSCELGLLLDVRVMCPN